jgi:hypothetical protein
MEVIRVALWTAVLGQERHRACWAEESRSGGLFSQLFVNTPEYTTVNGVGATEYNTVTEQWQSIGYYEFGHLRMNVTGNTDDFIRKYVLVAQI